MSIKSMISAAALCAAAASSFAQVHVDDVWVRATVPQQRATGAFMKITADRPMRLVAAQSPLTPTVEVHEMKMSGGVMTMRAVQGGLEVAPGKVTALTPGGYHVMLLDLHQQVKVGDKVPLTLVFEDQDKKRIRVETTAEARPLGAGAGMPMAPMPPMPPMQGMASMPH